MSTNSQDTTENLGILEKVKRVKAKDVLKDYFGTYGDRTLWLTGEQWKEVGFGLLCVVGFIGIAVVLIAQAGSKQAE